MSYDLYMIPLSLSDDFEMAMASLDEGGSAHMPGIIDDARAAAAKLIELDPRYTRFEKDYAAIAEFAGITEAMARSRYDHEELNGVDAAGKPLAQFIFHHDKIIVHCYGGTTNDELDFCIKSLCKLTGFGVVDPQMEQVLRLQADGTFA